VNVKSVLLASFVSTSISFAQQFNHPLALTGGDFVFGGKGKPRIASRVLYETAGRGDTLRLLAIMVEFQEDADSRTTGTGTFDLSSSTALIIDAPPHDRSYFLSHLTFLQSYFGNVSEGRIIIRSEVLNDVITLPQPMEAYSPPKEGPNRVLGDLLVDAWRAADSLHPEIDFSVFDVFTVFHAGVGRDIDLVSILGFDPTPLDIPSVFIGIEALKSFYGKSFRGVPVDGGSFFIDHSMILPETESRTISTITGDELLQLSINGLLCASLGSFVGLPDLFDTHTGRTAIGRFGLMDGQSIFSFSGLFPPEPSAWEKVYLGWVDPIVASPGATAFTARAAGLSGSDSTIFRIPISAREYFLVENRNRDPLKDGQTVTMVFNGATIQKTFLRDTVGFNAFDVSEVYGVVTDVDDYDWSLPGGVSPTGEFFDGGILIWHVDEDVIQANLSTNTVNADPMRRGVDLEEADGSQDIGHEFGFLSPGAGSEEGTALDFWFSGNIAPVYKNEFSSMTHPNSLSNASANSLVSIRDFSNRAPIMKFTVQIGDERISPLVGYPKFVGKSTGNYSPQVIQDKVFVSVNDSVFAYTLDGSSATPLSAGLFSAVGGQFPIAFVRQDGSDDIFAGVQDSSIIVWTASDLDTDGKYDVISTASIMTSGRISTSPAIHPSDFTLFVGDENGDVTVLRNDSVTAVQKISSERITSLALNAEIVNPLLSVVAITERELIPMAGDSIQLPYSSDEWEVVVGLFRSGSPFFVVSERGGGHLQVLDASLNVLLSRDFTSDGSGLSTVALGDINGDGMRDIVFASGKLLYALTPYGSALDYFPIRASGTITGDPIIADLNGDNELDIIFTTDEKQLVAVDRRGDPLPGFPLALDGINRFTPAAFASLMANTSVPGIVAVTGNGYVSGWQLKEVPGGIALPWASYRGNARHTAFENSQLLGDPITTAFFPEQRAYNWPNPVYEDRTNIRYYVSKDAVVRIKVFDLAGDLVDEFSGPGVGGFDNEVPWDVSNLQSGIYFARIEASSGAENGVAIIKIAVVK